MLFDAIKTADVKTVGNVAAAAGVAWGVYEVFGSRHPNYLWPGLLVAGGLAAHVMTMDPKALQSVGQGKGADAGASTVCQARDLGDQRQREGEVKVLPWVVTGAAVLLGGLVLKTFL